MTLTVIDIGCANHGTSSIDYLIERHLPDRFEGYDPLLPGGAVYTHKATHVVVCNVAVLPDYCEAWYQHKGSATKVNTDGRGTFVDAWSVRSIIQNQPGDIILKLDCEGSEYDLLEAILADGLDERIQLLYVEWHGDSTHLTQRRTSLEQNLRCPIQEWTL